MLLRKQTVWLLTMLSLVAVLSVYYITSPQETTVNQEAQEETENGKGGDSGNAEQSTVVSNEASDSAFEAMRMDLNDERSKEKEQLTEKVAELKKDLFTLRFQLATGQLQNTMQITAVKRDIARAKTVLRQLEQA